MLFATPILTTTLKTTPNVMSTYYLYSYLTSVGESYPIRTNGPFTVAGFENRLIQPLLQTPIVLLYNNYNIFLSKNQLI